MTHKIVVGLGFGDEAKGATVDWLCATNDIKAVVRYNGGPQAAHNVVQPDGYRHTFAQFGSGSFHGVPTFLSKYMLVNPFNLLKEAAALDPILPHDPLPHLYIDRDALLITPYHKAANRMKEDIRAGGRHGSTGQGIGETMRYAAKYPNLAPTMGDMGQPHLKHMLDDLYHWLDAELPLPLDLPSPEDLAKNYAEIAPMLNIVRSYVLDDFLASGDCVFEGAQGVLLDELYGFHPHVTYSKTTQANARDLLAGRQAEVYGLTRSYHTRHGAGPFPTENDRMIDYWPEPHNRDEHYQGGWRVGGLDLSLLKYAIHVNGGIDKLSVSHMDYVHKEYGVKAFSGYAHPESKYTSWLHPWETLGAPFSVEQSRALGDKMREVKPIFWGQMLDEHGVELAIEGATGIKPYLYSYGPTWKDRVLADVPALS